MNIKSLLICAALTLSIGCSTMSTEQRINNVASLANLAAYTGTAIHLEDNEQDAPFFAAAVAALDKLADDGTYQPAELLAALEVLPVDMLNDSGGKSAIIITGAVMLFDQGANQLITPDTPQAVRQIAAAIRDGINLALERQKGAN